MVNGWMKECLDNRNNNKDVVDAISSNWIIKWFKKQLTDSSESTWRCWIIFTRHDEKTTTTTTTKTAAQPNTAENRSNEWVSQLNGSVYGNQLVEWWMQRLQSTMWNEHRFEMEVWRAQQLSFSVAWFSKEVRSSGSECDDGDREDNSTDERIFIEI